MHDSLKQQTAVADPDTPDRTGAVGRAPTVSDSQAGRKEQLGQRRKVVTESTVPAASCVRI